jgi:acetyltransferase-like isoleucine patch superfamily enzyme
VAIDSGQIGDAGNRPDPAGPGVQAPRRDRLAFRAARIAWTLAAFVAVQVAVGGLAMVPFVILARALFEAVPGGWLQWTAAGAMVLPFYALFALLFMVCSAWASRLAGWRTPAPVVTRIADFDWPLLTWARYVAAVRLVNVLAGRLYCGSPVWTMYLRLNGARIGRRTYVNSTSVSDHNLIEFGDDVVIGADAHISGHTIERGVLMTGTVRIARGATVGIGAIIDIDVEIGAGCVVGALSLVPKHTRLEAGAVYVGIPVRRLR